ncbi:MAG: YcxB family protein [Clostridia bacterium]|nr:YcxB family protein [Clostridia bacterium]
MNIKASGRLDIRALKSLQRAHGGIMRLLSIIVGGFALLSFILMLLFLGLKAGFKIGWMLLLAGSVLMLLVFAAPRMTYKQLGKLKDVLNEYSFTDGEFTVATRMDGMDSVATFSYDLIEKAMETPEFFFIYQTKHTAFPVDKATIDGGTADELKEKLMKTLGNKYTVRRK